MVVPLADAVVHEGAVMIIAQDALIAIRTSQGSPSRSSQLEVQCELRGGRMILQVLHHLKPLATAIEARKRAGEASSSTLPAPCSLNPRRETAWALRGQASTSTCPVGSPVPRTS